MASPNTQNASPSPPIDVASTTASLTTLNLNLAPVSTLHPFPTPNTTTRGTSSPLVIPLDDSAPLTATAAPHPSLPVRGNPSERASLRAKPSRDSLRRREALLTGNPGTRRRQRFDNAHLLSNPFAVPPEPADFTVPTHDRREVPYAAACLWDARYASLTAERARVESEGREKGKKGLERLSRTQRAVLKRRGVQARLGELESVVRAFVEEWDTAAGGGSGMTGRGRGDSFVDVGESEDSSDEEVVFVGRRAHRHDTHAGDDKKAEKLVLDGLADDAGARFGRWLVHAIAQYYDLRAWSVTRAGRPAHREAYVGIKTAQTELPRPLWGIV